MKIKGICCLLTVITVFMTACGTSAKTYDDIVSNVSEEQSAAVISTDAVTVITNDGKIFITDVKTQKSFTLSKKLTAVKKGTVRRQKHLIETENISVYELKGVLLIIDKANNKFHMI